MDIRFGKSAKSITVKLQLEKALEPIVLRFVHPARLADVKPPHPPNALVPIELRDVQLEKSSFPVKLLH